MTFPDLTHSFKSTMMSAPPFWKLFPLIYNTQGRKHKEKKPFHLHRSFLVVYEMCHVQASCWQTLDLLSMVSFTARLFDTLESAALTQITAECLQWGRPAWAPCAQNWLRKEQHPNLHPITEKAWQILASRLPQEPLCAHPMPLSPSPSPSSGRAVGCGRSGGSNRCRTIFPAHCRPNATAPTQRECGHLPLRV